MKLTEDKIKYFEEEQKEFGTKVALKNFIFEIAWDLLKDIGNKEIHLK